MKLIILRGLPSSGKSTLAKSLQRFYHDCCIYSTDNFFTKDGKYNFDGSRLKEAHEWNQQLATGAMVAGVSCVVIDNTNTTSGEARPYVNAAQRLGYSVEVREPDTWWKFDVDELVQLSMNTHQVPREAIQRMLNRWQKDEDFKRELGI